MDITCQESRAHSQKTTAVSNYNMSSNKYETKTKVTLLAKQLLESINDPKPASYQVKTDSDSDSDDEDDFPHLYANIPPPPQTLTESLATQELLNSSNSTNIKTKIRELTLINALINDLGDRLIIYQKLTNDIFSGSLYNANPKPQHLSQKNCCSWKLHLMPDLVKDVSPPASQTIPDLRVTDPEGDVYTLEEVMPALDEEYYVKLVDKRAWHSWKMEEWMCKTDEVDADWHEARKDHFKQWKREIEGEEEEDETSDDGSSDTTLSDDDTSDDDTPLEYASNDALDDDTSDNNTSIYFTSNDTSDDETSLNDTSDEISDSNTSIYFTSDEASDDKTSTKDTLLISTSIDPTDGSASGTATILYTPPTTASLAKIRCLTNLITKIDTFLHTSLIETHLRDRAARLEEDAADAAWEKKWREEERWKIGKRVGGLLRKFMKDRGEKEWEMEWKKGRKLIVSMRGGGDSGNWRS
jgi:hypothetical protein